MAHNNREIEIQVKVEDVAPLLAFLAKKGTATGEKHQMDEYFSPVHDDFTQKRPVQEWLRLRDASGTHSLNYKNWHFDNAGKGSYCDEFETTIADPSAARQMLLALNFRSIATVDKVRRTWTYQDYEVAIDAVKGLGDFVEIEYIGTNSETDPHTVAEEMVAFLKRLGCGKIRRNFVGYPFLLLFPEEAKYEEV